MTRRHYQVSRFGPHARRVDSGLTSRRFGSVVWGVGLLVGFVVGLATFASAQDNPPPDAGGPWVRPLEWQTGDEPADEADELLVAVSLDRETHRWSRDDWGDLRLFDSSGRSVPYWLRPQTVDEHVLQRRAFSVGRLAANPGPAEGLEIEFTIDEERHVGPLHGLRIVSALKDFERQVSVWRWDDGESDWQPLVSDAFLYDYSRYLDVRSLDIDLGEASLANAAGRYRVRIDRPDIDREATQWRELTRDLGGDGRGELTERFRTDSTPFRIDRIESLRDDRVIQRSQPVLDDYPLEVVQVQQDPDEKTTWVELRSGREPLTEIVLETDDRNFSRAVRLSVPILPAQGQRFGANDSQPVGRWRELATGRWTRIDLAGVRQEKLKLPLAETRAAAYRVGIMNGDSPPLESLRFIGRGPRREVVFLASEQGNYRLGYGEPEREQPEYDTAAIRAALAAGALPRQATLGSAELALPTLSPSVWRWLQNPWLFGAVVLLLLVLLGGFLKQAAARLN
ncbi:MAG: hypothetical protein EA381_00430, partial [Planctomycetaceae bacterium]